MTNKRETKQVLKWYKVALNVAVGKCITGAIIPHIPHRFQQMGYNEAKVLQLTTHPVTGEAVDNERWIYLRRRLA